MVAFPRRGHHRSCHQIYGLCIPPHLAGVYSVLKDLPRRYRDVRAGAYGIRSLSGIGA